MYKHILLPTDGSHLAELAGVAGIELARAVGAAVTVLHVLPRDSEVALDAWAHQGATYNAQLADALLKRGLLYLETLREAAMYAGVPCDCRIVHASSVVAGIVEAAREGDCDLVVMAPHGRGDDAQAVLRSEAIKAVMFGTVPVLVHRPLSATGSPRAATRRNPASAPAAGA